MLHSFRLSIRFLRGVLLPKNVMFHEIGYGISMLFVEKWFMIKSANSLFLAIFLYFVLTFYAKKVIF